MTNFKQEYHKIMKQRQYDPEIAGWTIIVCSAALIIFTIGILSWLN